LEISFYLKEFPQTFYSIYRKFSCGAVTLLHYKFLGKNSEIISIGQQFAHKDICSGILDIVLLIYLPSYFPNDQKTAIWSSSQTAACYLSNPLKDWNMCLS